MSAFDKIIGYESIKNELLQVIDMIQNRDLYTKMGAKLPRGILLSGDPGLGKTMLCKAFIKESGLPYFTLRRNSGGGDFITTITESFEKAKNVAPSIVFLDDMDKFANEDMGHRDAEEYVAVQAGIDDVADADVFVIATVNEYHKLPRSLTRAGRFDRTIDVESPTAEDAEKIIQYYLSTKRVSPDVNLEDLAKMISYSSCAELETILNESAVSAAFKRKESIEMEDLVNTVLKTQYNVMDVDDDCNKNDDERRSIALHEAGHLVVSEVLCPGSVGFASIRPESHSDHGGFVHRCKNLSRRPWLVMVSLAGKAAVELYYADHVAAGCNSDLYRAKEMIRDGMAENATMGYGLLDCYNDNNGNSQDLNGRQEAVTHALMEDFTRRARDVLIKNRAFLERITEELCEKGQLLYSDIQRIRNENPIVSVTV